MSEEQTLDDGLDEEFTDEELDEVAEEPADGAEPLADDAPPPADALPDERDAQIERLKHEVGAQGTEIGLMRQELAKYRPTKDDASAPDAEPDPPEVATAKELYQSRGSVLVGRWHAQGLSDDDIKANPDCQEELRYLWSDCNAIAGVTEKRAKTVEDRARAAASPLLEQAHQGALTQDVTALLAELGVPDVTPADLADDLGKVTRDMWAAASPEERKDFIGKLGWAAYGVKQAQAKADPPKTAPRTPPGVSTPTITDKPAPDPKLSRAVRQLMDANPTLTREMATTAATRYLKNGGTL